MVEAVVGAALGVGFRAVAVARGGKPLHPSGALFAGTLRCHGLDPGVGVPWLDTAGESPVQVRLSRSVGTPHPLPDVLGIAVRARRGDEVGDLLLASTGQGRLTRFALVPRRHWGFCSTLFPYRTDRGPLLIAAQPRLDTPLPADVASLLSRVEQGPLVLDLLCAPAAGPWRSFGALHVTGRAAADIDPPLAFDPVEHAVAGLAPYGWSARLRAPAYAGARAGRGVPDPA